MMKKDQKTLLMALLALCMGVILAGGLHYVSTMREDLTAQAVRNVMTVTRQQQQALDNFISGDRERLHSFADYFSKNGSEDADMIRSQLKVFGEVDAFYTVVNLYNGRFFSNKSNQVFQLEGEELASYRALMGDGVRDPFTGLNASGAMFGYYESFTFANGIRGLIQKSYDRNKVSEAFSLSFYDDRGLGYVVNQKGDILLHSNGTLDGREYDNILDALSGGHDAQEEAEEFLDALQRREPGSAVFAGGGGSFVYTYVPVENVPGWTLVSVVSMDAITEETEQILRDSQLTFLLLMGILAVCAIVVLLIWRTHKDIAQKDREIRYQVELFDIFSSYLSSNTNDVYMLIDLDRERIEYISPNVERVLGIPPGEISADIRSFVGTGNGEEKLDADEIYAMEPGDAIKPITTSWTNPRTKQYQWFQVNIYCTAVQGESRLVLYISDRTEERKIQDGLSEALDLARMANDAKSAFLSSVSHDIRTPMNAIIGLVALLREEPDDPEVVLEYTQRIDAASQHLLGLINDVLDMNKIESGSASLNLSEMSMAGVVEEINTIIRPQAKAKDQVFDIFVSSLVYEHLQGDKLRINQILINLLSNAVKYTPAGGRIEMRVEELPQVVEKYSRIRFTISDNGLGMSPEYLKVIFDPFTREEKKSTHGIQGTGLGMAITKSLVDLMGGSIRVESTPGRGSTFTVELELRIQEREEDPRFWKDHKVARMIVADDEEEICRNIARAMEGTGVVTDRSTDGETAVQMMRTAWEEGRPYDLILLDWKMPGLDGLETARRIRESYPEEIPILLFTAYDWGEIEQEAREIGVDHFLPKPFFMSTFKEAIRRVMGDTGKVETSEDSAVEGRHILVVDDIEVNRLILVKILRTLGAECDTAANGQEALDAFEASEPGEYDIILMDVQMPVMDGYAATRAIRASRHPEAKTVPIIAMTANAFMDDVRDAISSGMDAHIAKPVQVDKLKSTIRQVLDSRTQQGTEDGEGSSEL
ncbi:response regulator [uncultured Oscillibacter sp.]|uniref:response regulator n=2 Tax=uncultured Oscillibacter sp. TaxID=876091 RepID=UPI0026035E11|nr:response regulator [uncultured Oscillibacter sp.]